MIASSPTLRVSSSVPGHNPLHPQISSSCAGRFRSWAGPAHGGSGLYDHYPAGARPWYRGARMGRHNFTGGWQTLIYGGFPGSHRDPLARTETRWSGELGGNIYPLERQAEERRVIVKIAPVKITTDAVFS